MMSKASIPWPHAPAHRLTEAGAYMVTAGTYRKEHRFGSPERLVVLHRGLLKLTANYGWTLEAWAVFSNHYHFIAQAPADGAANLSIMLKELHAKSALWINRLDQQPGRMVWHNFWETRLTHQRSYLARLNYVHQNAVRHGLVNVASHYPWSSAGWFEQTADPVQVRTIYGFKIDRIGVDDEFMPGCEW
jgi:putative transposase